MVLLTRFTDGTENYRDIGRKFQIVMKETAPARFEDSLNACFGGNRTGFEKECYGFIVCYDGSEFHPLYINQSNYILSDSVEVFKDLCLK